MSKYIVMTIALAVKKNRIAKFGETVSESELTVNSEELINSGAIALIDTSAKTSIEQTKAEEVAEEVENTLDATKEADEEKVDNETKAEEVLEKKLSKKDQVKAALGKQ